MKAKAIFDYVIDDPQKDGPTLSIIVSACPRFEAASLKCPNAVATDQSFSADKLTPMYPTGTIVITERL